MTKRWAVARMAALGAATWPGLASASGDYGCTPRWSMAVSNYDCAGTALIGPRNDTRMNLALLLRTPNTAQAYPKWDWDNAEFGHVFVDWDGLQTAFWPSRDLAFAGEEPKYAGSRCQTLVSGGQAFRNALAASKDVTAADRNTLNAARDLLEPACDGDRASPSWPQVQGGAAQAWLAYLQGAWAFYADDFTTADTRFAALTTARETWLAETARYMVARNQLAVAQASAIDEWGGFAGLDKVDRAAASRAQVALQGYLSAYPEGRYTASAKGLTRRTAWLLGDGLGLASTYSTLLAAPSRSPDLLEEVESKVFSGTGVNDVQAPLLLATWDLLRMRQANPDPYGSTPPAPLTEQDLAAQAPAFARQRDLYTFLQASLAYHGAKDHARVLALIPQDLKASTPLGFSRQMLRGLALEALGDPAAARLFEHLARKPGDLYQQPAAQLALATHWERKGTLASVFAPGSAVTDPSIRTILLARIAPPALLRGQARAGDASQAERDVALFTLLAKNLSRGRYGDFLSDLKAAPAATATAGWVDVWSSSWLSDEPEQRPPLGLFRQGKWQEDYACPALSQTAATLAAQPAHSRSRLCLAEFWRLNGFDTYLATSGNRRVDQLGGSQDLFPGIVTHRSALYAVVLADRTATPDDTAYALYRSIQCYAPSRNNACGGQEVPVETRKSWFQRLKRDYSTSRWARDLKCYW